MTLYQAKTITITIVMGDPAAAAAPAAGSPWTCGSSLVLSSIRNRKDAVSCGRRKKPAIATPNSTPGTTGKSSMPWPRVRNGRSGAVRKARAALAAAAAAVTEQLRRGGRLDLRRRRQLHPHRGPGRLGAPRDVRLRAGAVDLPHRRRARGAARRTRQRRRRRRGGARSAVEAHDLGAQDVLIAVSASGSTPYTLAAAKAAKARGTVLIGIANNRAAPLLKEADHPVLLESGPEVIAGSTRLGAGTAQKCALGLLSTLVNIRLGAVYDGMMINLQGRQRETEGAGTRHGVADRQGGRAAGGTGARREPWRSGAAPALICAGAEGLAQAQALLAQGKRKFATGAGQASRVIMPVRDGVGTLRRRKR